MYGNKNQRVPIGPTVFLWKWGNGNVAEMGTRREWELLLTKRLYDAYTLPTIRFSGHSVEVRSKRNSMQDMCTGWVKK